MKAKFTGVVVRLPNGQVLEYHDAQYIKSKNESRAYHIYRNANPKDDQSGDVWVTASGVVFEVNMSPDKMYNTITFPDAVLQNLTSEDKE